MSVYFWHLKFYSHVEVLVSSSILFSRAGTKTSASKQCKVSIEVGLYTADMLMVVVKSACSAGF